MFSFDKCDNKTATLPCKSEEEISDWMIDKYIVVMKNEKKFIAHKFQEERIAKSARLDWYALNP